MALNDDLDGLLLDPSETLDVELKEWLDLNDNNHRAMIAKEIIALANHGGGYLVIGFAEQPDGSFQTATPRPPNLNDWAQDAIQSVVAKFVDPTVQCKVIHRPKPGSQDRYPIIIVPGGHRVPMRSKAGSPNGKLIPHRVYVRRPGPSSEEPRTAEEWDRLLERCLQNRKAELLEAMRSIISGVIPTAHQKTPSRFDQLLAFEQEAIARWDLLVAPIPATASAKFPHGSYDIGVAIDGSIDQVTLGQLREIISTEVRNHSGYPPFLTLSRLPPKPINGAVAFWRQPEGDLADVPSRHDFWRISPSGLFFTRCGFHEDSREPGKFFDIVISPRRVGEAIMEAAYIARALNATNANLICRCQWRGLRDRLLVSRGNPRRAPFLDDYTSAQDTYEHSEAVALDALPEALPEVVFAILAPLYELFDFFKLPKRLVEEELASLLSNRFAS